VTHTRQGARSIACALAIVLLATAPARGRELPRPTVVEKNGLRYGVIRPVQNKRPAPTLVFLVTSIDDTFNATFGGVPQRMHDAGWLLVTLDLPGHGLERRPDKTVKPQSAPDRDPELLGWRLRMGAGEDILTPFLRKLTAVITELVRSSDADPKRIFSGGISRGGFIALHYAAADRRVAGVVCLIPVTELSALAEFKGLPHTHAQDVSRVAPALAGRPILITIGTNDDRVGTDATLRFAESVVSAARRKGVPNRLELQVRETPGHSYPSDAEAQAAAWLLRLAGAIK
jgi:dienelactone hydrolase